MSRLHQVWRVLGITTKTTVAFSLLAVLLIAESGINFFVLRSVRQAEAEMMRSMEFSQRIFEIFQRLHRSEEYSGTGVGLAIVHKAIERMGGRSWANSEPGIATTFYLEVPLHSHPGGV